MAQNVRFNDLKTPQAHANHYSGKQQRHTRTRVVCENAFAGVKRYNAVSGVYRHRIEAFDDHLILTAAGLWNFYLMAA
jgi:hypothetical protein